MIKLKQILIILYVIFVAGCAPVLRMPPKEDIPENIPSNVRKQIERLYSSDALERGRAARALGHAAAVPFLIGILDDRAKLEWRRFCTTMSEPWRGATYPGQEAAEALVKIGEPAVEPLITALDDRLGVRIKAAIALGEIGDTRAVEPLIAKLKYEKNIKENEVAAEALGKIGDTRAVKPLIATLNNKDFFRVRREVRYKAAIALGEIGDARAVEPLIAALKDESAVTRSSAARALQRITNQNFGQDQTKWQQWWDENKDEILKDRYKIK